MEEKKVNIKAGAGVYRHFRGYNLDAWTCIGEFVDNSLGSFLDKQTQKRLKSIHSKPLLEVNVKRDKENRTITIEDNAGGISDSDLDRALVIGDRPKNAKGFNEFGVGMKMSAFWFADRWSITTTALGENYIKEIVFDVDEIEAEDIQELPVVNIGSAKADEHYTIIKLESIYEDHFPIRNTLKKIKTHLKSMYRRLTVNNTMILNFNDGNGGWESLSYDQPDILKMPYVFAGEEEKNKDILWREKISFEQSTQSGVKKITGWVGLLAQSKKGNAGFSLVRRSRVIEGQENAWRPDNNDSYDHIIFSGNSEPSARLFGEFDMSGFEVSNNKSKIHWGKEEDEIKENFLKYLYYHIKKKKFINSSKTTNHEFWNQLLNYLKPQETEEDGKPIDEFYPEKMDDVISQLQNVHSEVVFPSKDDIDKAGKADLGSAQELDFPEKYFEINVTDSEQWKISIQPVSNNGASSWFSYKAIKNEKKWPRVLVINFDMDHSYTKTLFPNAEAFDSTANSILRIYAYLCVIEQSAIEDDGNEPVNPSYFRDYLNQILLSAG